MILMVITILYILELIKNKKPHPKQDEVLFFNLLFR